MDQMHSLEIPTEGIGIRAALTSHDGSGAVAGIRGGPLVKDALLKGEVTGSIGKIGSDLIDKLRTSSEDAGADDEPQTHFTITMTVAYSQNQNRVIARADDDAVLVSRMDIEVEASLTDQVQQLAESTVSQRDEDEGDDAYSGAVIVGIFDNTVKAEVAVRIREEA